MSGMRVLVQFIVLGEEEQTSPTVELPSAPRAGEYIEWRLGGKIPQGTYKVYEISWVLTGSALIYCFLTPTGQPLHPLT